MAQEKRLGSTIPRGVVDTKNGSVGVPDQASMEEEVRSLREQVNALTEKLSDLGIYSGRAIADTGRRAGEMARNIPPGRHSPWSVFWGCSLQGPAGPIGIRGAPRASRT